MSADPSDPDESSGLESTTPTATSFREELAALVRLSIPVALVQLGMMVMGVVDTMMVGRVSEQALSALALGHYFSLSLWVPCQGILFALDPLVSQAHGARDPRSIALALKRGTVLSLMVAVPLVAVLQGADTMLGWLGQPAEIVPLAADYTRAVSWGLPFFLFFFVLRQSLQGMSIVRPVLWSVLIANLVNVFLNWTLVFGKLGFPELGPVGAGWASTGSRALMAAVAFQLTWPRLRPMWRRAVPNAWNLRAVGPMFLLGLPMGLQVGLEVWGFTTVGFLMGYHDRLLGAGGLPGATQDIKALAGHQVAMNLAALAFMVPLAVGGAAATRVGNAIGRGDPRSARRSAFTALGLGASFMLITAGCFIFLPHAMARLYTDEGTILAAAALLLPIAGIFQVFDGSQAVGCGVLRGAADARFAAGCNLLGYWVLGLPLGWWLTFRRGFGPQGLWYGLTVGLLVVSVLIVWRIVHTFTGEHVPQAVTPNAP